MWFLSDPKNYYTIHKYSLLIYPPNQTSRVQASNKNAKVWDWFLKWKSWEHYEHSVKDKAFPNGSCMPTMYLGQSFFNMNKESWQVGSAFSLFLPEELSEKLTSFDRFLDAAWRICRSMNSESPFYSAVQSSWGRPDDDQSFADVGTNLEGRAAGVCKHWELL